MLSTYLVKLNYSYLKYKSVPKGLRLLAAFLTRNLTSPRHLPNLLAKIQIRKLNLELQLFKHLYKRKVEVHMFS